MNAGYFPALFSMYNIARFAIWFYVGYCFEKHRDKLSLPRILCPISLILLMILNFVQLTDFIPDYPLYFITALTGMLFIYTLSSILCRHHISKNRLYRTLSQNSFGIYLFHPMIIYVLFYYTGSLRLAPILLGGAIFLTSLFLSLSLTLLLRRLGLGLLLGE